MHEILSANPGIGFGPEWIDERIKEIYEINFDYYVQFERPDHYNQLKAMWIVAEKAGGGSEFWITDDTPQLFSWAMCCNFPNTQRSISKLVDRANRFISKMAKDTPYWKEYPKFPKTDIVVSPPEPSECSKKIKALSISARLHLFFAIEMGGGSLPNLTNYAIRSFGISTEETSSQILESKLFITSSDPDALSNSLGKQELSEACNGAGIEIRKSWTKKKLAQALCENNLEYFDNVIKKMNVVSINPEYQDELKSLSLYAKGLSQVFKVLCFL